MTTQAPLSTPEILQKLESLFSLPPSESNVLVLTPTPPKEYVSDAEMGITYKAAPSPSSTSYKPSIPLVDAKGERRYIPTRECWCDDNGVTDCRYHSINEKGWETCPSKNLPTAQGRRKSRWLWGLNPNFGKKAEKQAQQE